MSQERVQGQGVENGETPPEQERRGPEPPPGHSGSDAGSGNIDYCFQSTYLLDTALHKSVRLLILLFSSLFCI